MTVMLLSKTVAATFGPKLEEIAGRAGLMLEIMHLPDDSQARLAADDGGRVNLAVVTRDVRHSPLYPSLCEALVAAPRLEWVHFDSTAIEQHAFVPALRARGVKLTTSAGSNGEPVAQTAIMTLLMMSRGAGHWLDAQRRGRWEPLRGDKQPRDLRGQTILIVGMGHIGATIARFAKVLGMHVLGIRRKPMMPDDPVDEMHQLPAFSELLPRSDWVVLACPLTPDTRNLVNAQSIARMKRGAGLINVARGAICDERSVIAAIESGQIGHAHLDVFETEPLPGSSPLWALRNLILTPHNASASAGNEARGVEMLLMNFENWTQGRPLVNLYAA